MALAVTKTLEAADNNGGALDIPDQFKHIFHNKAYFRRGGNMCSRVGVVDGEIEITDGKNRLTVVVEYKPDGGVQIFQDAWPNYCNYRGIQAGDKLVLLVPDKLHRRVFRLIFHRGDTTIASPVNHFNLNRAYLEQVVCGLPRPKVGVIAIKAATEAAVAAEASKRGNGFD